MILDSLNTEERAKLSQGKCPDCDRQLLNGLQGSGIINITCQSCDAVFGMIIRFNQSILEKFFEEEGE